MGLIHFSPTQVNARVYLLHGPNFLAMAPGHGSYRGHFPT